MLEIAPKSIPTQIATAPPPMPRNGLNGDRGRVPPPLRRRRPPADHPLGCHPGTSVVEDMFGKRRIVANAGEQHRAYRA